jgi:hypothetical protein
LPTKGLYQDDTRKVTMMPSIHLSIDELAAYLADPEATASAEAGRHLTRCAACRQRLSVLSALKRERPTTQPEESAADAVQSDRELLGMSKTHAIERYVEGRLDGEERTRVQNKMAQQPAALKAALHYARHSAAMQRALDTSAKVSSTSGAEARGWQPKAILPPLLAAIKVWLSRRIPLWAAMPAGVLALGGLAFFLIFLYPPHQSRLEIAHYRDNPVIQFQTPHQGPGVGFFHIAPARVAPFPEVKVSLVGPGRLEIAWPPVAQATAYRIHLSTFENGNAVALRTITLKDLKSTDPRALFEGLAIVPGRRYVWKLSGTTTDHALFQAEGGFVFYQRNS